MKDLTDTFFAGAKKYAIKGAYVWQAEGYGIGIASSDSCSENRDAIPIKYRAVDSFCHVRAS
jgi:hypothetical protein